MTTTPGTRPSSRADETTTSPWRIAVSCALAVVALVLLQLVLSSPPAGAAAPAGAVTSVDAASPADGAATRW